MSQIEKLRYYCYKVLPLVYDDSLSYYELVNKIASKINEIIPVVNDVSEKIDEDVRAILDEWNEDGTLVNLIAAYYEHTEEELKDYIDTVTAEYNADMQETYDNRYSAIQAKLSAQDVDIDVISERVNQIASLPSGSTSADAELQDIRIGYNAQNYSSAGNAVRTQVKNITYNIDLLRGYNLLSPYPKSGRTAGGVTFAPNGDKYDVSGTATSKTFNNVYSGGIPDGLTPGSIFGCGLIGGLGGCYLAIYSLDASNNAALIGTTTNAYREFKIPNGTVSLLIRIDVDNGTTLTESVYPYIVNSECVFTSDKVKHLIPSGDTTGAIDRANIILSLEKYDIVKLEAGNYYISNSIIVPDNKTFCGVGTNLVNIRSTYTLTQQSSVMPIGDNTEIYGFTLDGNENGESIGYKIGVFCGTRQNANSNRKIHDIVLKNFNASAILMRTGNTGTYGDIIENVEIINSFIGINLEERNEYIRISNCLTYGCQYGTIVGGGNNMFSNCIFASGLYGARLTPGYNNSHGSFSNCSFNHNTVGIDIQNIDYGEVFNGCQIHYGEVVINADAKGVLFNGCEFGNQILLRGNNSNASIMNSIFYSNPTIITGIGAFINCYNFQTNTPVTN